jgi:hypothetical protein
LTEDRFEKQVIVACCSIAGPFAEHFQQDLIVKVFQQRIGDQLCPAVILKRLGKSPDNLCIHRVAGLGRSALKIAPKRLWKPDLELSNAP